MALISCNPFFNFLNYF